MKKLALILCMLLLVTLFGCSKRQEDFSTLIAICSGKAQEYIDAGDYDNARRVLEEGIAASDSEELKAMLEALEAQRAEESEEPEEPEEATLTCSGCEAEIPADARFCPSCGADTTGEAPEETPSTPGKVPALAPEKPVSEPVSGSDSDAVSLDSYVGIWVYADTNPQYIDPSLELKVEQDQLLVNFITVSDPPASRVAMVDAQVALSSVADNTVSFPFTDSWGNSGTMTLDFNDTIVRCSITDLTHSDGAMWGVSEGTYIFETHHATMEALNAALEQNDLLNTYLPEDIAYTNYFLDAFTMQHVQSYEMTEPLSSCGSFAHGYYRNFEPDGILRAEQGYPVEYALEVIPAASVDSVAQYFFNQTPVHPETSQWVVENWAYYDSATQNYHFVMGGGEYSGYIAAVSGIHKNQGGMLDISFTVYEIDSEVYYSGDVTLDDYLPLTAEQAAQRSDLQYYASGQATVGFQTLYDGSTGYYLESYCLSP